jgi:uncharacterized protein (DUF58 family)
MSRAGTTEASAPLSMLLEKARRIALRTRKAVDEQLAGSHRSLFRARGMDFDEVREYTPGDEVRAIDWNVTARAGRPFVKKFREERELTVMLVVDVSASGSFGSGTVSKRELAAELASVLALAGLRSRDKVGLVLFSDRVERVVPPRGGQGHVLALVHEILRAAPEHPGTDVAAALDFVNTILHRRAAVVVVSDFHTHGDTSARARLVRALGRTGRRHDLTAVWLHDPHERELPDVGRLTLEDVETGEVVEIDTGRRKVRERFRAAARAREEALAQELRGAGAAIVAIDVSRDYLPDLLHNFGARAGRRS